MKNYKINIDKPKPTQEEILSGRNFDSVLAQYKAAPGQVIKKPFWKTTGFVSSVVAVAATVTIVALVISGKGEQNTDESNGPALTNNATTRQPGDDSAAQWSPTKRHVAPPLAGVNVPFNKYKINAKRGGTFTHTTGSKIKFQAGSFVDANGNPVAGNVEVRYREMHDAVDFFLSGVPMQYDSAGKTWQLESAGMLEIAAFVDGKVVYLDKNKPMEVELASAYNGTQYNLYEFDSVAGNWAYRGKDEAAMMPVDNEKRKKDSLDWVQRMLAQQQQQPGPGFVRGNDEVLVMPVDAAKPTKADPKKNRFVVDFNREEFPEMASFQNVIFEVDESKEKFDQGNYGITWETIALSRGDVESKYKLTLRKGLKVLKLDVYPVLDGKDYEAAMAGYEQKHRKYIADSAAYAQRVANWKENPVNPAVQNPVVQNPGMGNRNQQVGQPGEGWVYTAGNDENSIALTKDVMRTFALTGFGIYNMDVASQLPQGSVIDLSVNGPDDQLFSGFTAIYHVDRQKNTVMTYHNMNPMTGFHVNTASSNLVWAVKEGELYYADNESFANFPMIGNAVLALKKVAKKLNTADEMRAFFNLGTPTAAK